MRPISLAEVVDVGRPDIWIPLAEFMDEFYMLHGNRTAQQAMIDDEPHILDDLTVSAANLVLQGGVRRTEETFTFPVANGP